MTKQDVKAPGPLVYCFTQCADDGFIVSGDLQDNLVQLQDVDVRTESPHGLDLPETVGLLGTEGKGVTWDIVNESGKLKNLLSYYSNMFMFDKSGCEYMVLCLGCE